MAGKQCYVCHEIINNRNYRSVKQNLQIIQEICPRLQFDLSLSALYICNMCFNKVLKISKIDEKLNCVVDNLKAERGCIISSLKIKNDTVMQQTTGVTPKKGVKRLQINTPTPKKTLKKPALITPPPCIDNKRIHSIPRPGRTLLPKVLCPLSVDETLSEVEPLKQIKDEGTQTMTSFLQTQTREYHVKVSIDHG